MQIMWEYQKVSDKTKESLLLVRARLQISVSTISGVLTEKTETFPCKIPLLLRLLWHYYSSSLDYSQKILVEMRKNFEYLEQFIISDEFFLPYYGAQIKRNADVLVQGNPHSVKKVPLTLKETMLQGVIRRKKIICPYSFFEKTVNSINSKITLLLCDAQKIRVSGDPVFQEKSINPHLPFDVGRRLKTRFPELWTGKQG